MDTQPPNIGAVLRDLAEVLHSEQDSPSYVSHRKITPSTGVVLMISPLPEDDAESPRNATVTRITVDISDPAEWKAEVVTNSGMCFSPIWNRLGGRYPEVFVSATYKGI